MNIRCAAGAACILTLAASGGVAAQGPLTRLSLDDAVSLAARANATVRAKEFEHQAVTANEITAGLRPNPTASFLAEQFGGASDASQTLAAREKAKADIRLARANAWWTSRRR